ncbi:MAG: hypothetical protein M1828_006047 [Chrysothrix sp. TS-e1954]|nr:MAG: hypothetical protein M1828_006047 [Chrysothrix sp. TS-e1954]
MSKPTAGWDRIGDGFYRRVSLYSDIFDTDLDLSNYLISGAPYSGALALHRDENQVYAFRGGDVYKSGVDLYSSSGRLIRRLNWDKGPIRGLGWSADEKLIVVSQDGTVRCYPDLSEDFLPFSLGQEAEQNGVLSCRFWPSGFVALLGNNRLVAIDRYDEPRPKLLATPPSDAVVSWTMIPPTHSLSKAVEVLLAIGQTINVVDASDSEDRMLQNGPFRHIQVSPNGRFIALYTDDGKVWVISSDFQDKLSEYDTRSKAVPKDMQWCGDDAVVLSWEDELHLVGPNGAAAKYYYDGQVQMVPDIDGIRIFTNNVCEFLQKVPDVTEDTFKVGSSSPSAILLDAVEQLERMSPKADDNIQLIKNSLVDAVDFCIAAAGHEYDHHWQKQLLKASSFGKNAIDGYDSDDFQSMCETIRVLNAVRFYEVGIPLSYEQYLRLGPERLIRRLIYRQEYPIALRMAEYLHLPNDRIYVHWASRKVRTSGEDEALICAQIVDKFDGLDGISYEETARAAYDEGRHGLATQLLKNESRAGKQVPLLLDMGEDTVALDTAIDSGDTDLVLFVLLNLRKKMPLANFFRTINTRPVATSLVETTARDEDRDLLKDLYYQDDRRLDGSNLLFADALNQADPQATIDRLRTSAKLLQDSKELTSHTKCIEDTARLLRIQQTLDSDPTYFSTDGGSQASSTPFSGLSLNQTIHLLILHGHHKRAQQAISDFKVPERVAWWLQLRALVSARNWRELETVASKNRKSPIGWEPFFNETLSAGRPQLAGNTFVPKCTSMSYKERAEMYVKCGMVVKAGEEALKGKDREWLEDLRGKVEGRDKVEVDRLIGMLSKGR